MAHRNWIHGHTGGVGFSQVNGANMGLKQSRLIQKGFQIYPLGRRQFAGDYKIG
jgi:hypothetical protein